MSTRTKVWFSLSFLLVFSMILAACTTPTPQIITQEVIKTVEVQVPGETVKETVVVTVPAEPVQPTPEPVTRTGAWLDRIVMVEEGSQESAVTRLQAGDLDLYAHGMDNANVFQTVSSDPNLSYVFSYGSYNELTFNPAGPTFADGRLNPFSDAKVREAMNWLIDRNYVVQEIYSGLGSPKVLPISAASTDYARYIGTIRAMENKYAYNVDKANEVITAEMTAMGATMTDGKWTFNGAPVTIIAIIRTEDKRKDIGDYVCNQLESIGFTTDRQYKTRSEASPIWNQADPTQGLMHFYTGGWITTVLSRDEATNFGYFYTPMGSGSPLWQAYKNAPEFTDVATKLWGNDFTSIAERDQLFETAIPLAMQDSNRVWINDQKSFAPFKANIAVAYDLAGGIEGGRLWPRTLRWTDQMGGSMKVANVGLLVEPWNPVAGSNWVYDSMPIIATSDYGLLPDPYTGLNIPSRIEKAEITVKSGLPVGKTLDWVTLDTADTIEVPSDAWVDWDPVAQKFITAGEKFTQTVTANSKSVVYYPADLFSKVKWHDGSPVSVGDFVMTMITSFDYGKEGSPNFDQSLKDSQVDPFMSHFKGVRIVSTDPLVIETYDDYWNIDAELIPTTWWPQYGFGPGPWHTIAVGNLADAAGELAWSTDKAGTNSVEWISFIDGPSLPILKKYLDQAAGETLIPYAPTMSQYVTADEATARWTNLDRWYSEEGHFWVGSGVFYLDKVFSVEKTLTLLRFEDYPDLATKWAGYSQPKIADVEVDGPGSVTTGTDATFDVYVTFNGEPYMNADIQGVKWLLFDATGNLAANGDATAAEDGHFTIALTADQTKALAAGSNKLEVAVSSKVVAVPGIGSIEFVTVAP